MTVDHVAVDRADLVREDDKAVADGDLVKRDIEHGTVAVSPLPVSEGGHASGEGFQNRRGAPDSVGLDCLASRKHQDDQRAGKVFIKQDRGNDGNTRQQISAELAAEQFRQQVEQERPAPEHEARQEREAVDRDPPD